MRQGKAEPCTIYYLASRSLTELTSVFHHIPSVGPMQLQALAHLDCTRKVGISFYLQTNKDVKRFQIFLKTFYGFINLKGKFLASFHRTLYYLKHKTLSFETSLKTFLRDFFLPHDLDQNKKMK